MIMIIYQCTCRWDIMQDYLLERTQNKIRKYNVEIRVLSIAANVCWALHSGQRLNSEHYHVMCLYFAIGFTSHLLVFKLDTS